MEVVEQPLPRRRREARADPYELRRLAYLRRTGREPEEAEQLRAQVAALVAIGAITRRPKGEPWKTPRSAPASM